MRLMAHLSVALAVVGGVFVPNAQAATPAQIEAQLRELDAGWENASRPRTWRESFPPMLMTGETPDE
jgi:hypothetical protein